MIKFMISIFYSFVHSRSSLGILLNFDPLRSIQCTYFGPLFKWIYGQHKFSLLQFLVENCIKWQHILKNTAQIKIIITIRVENCTNSGAKFLFFFVQIAALTVIMQYFWEYDVIYSNSQWRTRKRKINGSAKFSETKVQKLCVVTFIIDWNLARYLGKTYCVQKWMRIWS